MLVVKPVEQRINNGNLLTRVIDLESETKKNEDLILSLKKKFLDARHMVLMSLDLLAVKYSSLYSGISPFRLRPNSNSYSICSSTPTNRER